MPTRRRVTSKKVYGSRKVREMQRSVLPSTSRRFARRSLDQVRRQGRRTTASHLARYRGPADLVIDSALDEHADLVAWPDHRIRDEVEERRLADKVGPLVRWGVARTRHLPADERHSHLRSVLPNTLVGRHALSHLERWI